MTLVRLSSVETNNTPDLSNSDNDNVVRSSQTQRAQEVWPASRARKTRYISRILTLILLILGAIFILLSLLLPTYKQGLSVFAIQPVGHQYEADLIRDGTSGSPGVVQALPSATMMSNSEVRGPSDVEGSLRDRSRSELNTRANEALVRLGPDGRQRIGTGSKRAQVIGGSDDGLERIQDDNITWFGLDGPTIWVGAMRG